MRPGSMPWLLAHDVRIAWRDFRSTFRAIDDRALALLLIVLLAVMHGVVWPLVARFVTVPTDAAGRTETEFGAAPVAAFVLMLMAAQTLNGVTKALYSRGDLDLLLSSPISARKILFVRALAVASGAFVSAAIFVLPLADAGALQGNPRLLAAYPALAGGALLAASAGLVIAFALFALIGPRRTRLAAQVLATFIGAAFMLGLQLHRFLPAFALGSVLEGSGLVADALLLPVRAALGEPAPLALWMAGTTGIFATTCLLFGRRFAKNVVAASGFAAGRQRGTGFSRAGTVSARGSRDVFRAGVLGALRAKERRLIVRDPWVVSQILLQILYMSPMILLLWSGSGSVGLALAPMTVVVTFQVASSLTWLGLSGEDAPDLLQTAPVTSRTLHRGKVEGVGVLTLCIVALPLSWLAWSSPGAFVPTLPLCGLGLAAAVALQTWHGKPARRSAFAARHRESKLVALIEMAISMLLGITTALAVLGSAWCALPLGCVAGVVLCSRPGKRAPAGIALRVGRAG